MRIKIKSNEEQDLPLEVWLEECHDSVQMKIRHGTIEKNLLRITENGIVRCSSVDPIPLPMDEVGKVDLI